MNDEQKSLFLKLGRAFAPVSLSESEHKLAQTLNNTYTRYISSRFWTLSFEGYEEYRKMTSYAHYAPGDLYLYRHEEDTVDAEFTDFIQWAQKNLPEAQSLSEETLHLMYLAFQIGHDAATRGAL